MNENTTLPASVRERLELAQRHADAGDFRQADNVLREMARALASSAPELCALLMASQLGFEGYHTEFVDEDVNETRSPRRFLGIKYQEDIVTQTVTRRIVRTGRLIRREEE